MEGAVICSLCAESRARLAVVLIPVLSESVLLEGVVIRMNDVAVV